jgi:hypothetical protein
MWWTIIGEKRNRIADQPGIARELQAAALEKQHPRHEEGRLHDQRGRRRVT